MISLELFQDEEKISASDFVRSSASTPMVEPDSLSEV